MFHACSLLIPSNPAIHHLKSFLIQNHIFHRAHFQSNPISKKICRKKKLQLHKYFIINKIPRNNEIISHLTVNILVGTRQASHCHLSQKKNIQWLFNSASASLAHTTMFASIQQPAKKEKREYKMIAAMPQPAAYRQP